MSGSGIVTTVQDGVSSFVNGNPWILEGDLGRIASLVCVDEKKRDFWQEVGKFAAVFVASLMEFLTRENRKIKPKETTVAMRRSVKFLRICDSAEMDFANIYCGGWVVTKLPILN